MNAQNNLLELFSNMKDEFNSSNNLIMREIDHIFKCELGDLSSSLTMFNDEYGLLSESQLQQEIRNLCEKIFKLKVTHASKYNAKYDRELANLEKNMCNFFNNKLVKGKECKKKMSNEIKDIVDKICDFGILSFEEDIADEMYNFRVNFEMNYINSEYSKDDLNKIVRSSKHCLIQKLRDHMLNSVNEKQEIVSRYASKAYEIVDYYNEIKR